MSDSKPFPFNCVEITEVAIDSSRKRKMMDAVDSANKLVIRCQAEKQRAVDLFRDVKAIKLDIEGIYEPHIANAKAVVSGLNKDLKNRIKPLEEGMDVIKDKINKSDEGWHVDGEYKRKNTTVKIVDEKLIPREYLMPDTRKIQKVADALGEDTSIPGISVKVEEKSVIRMME